tara:strand:+ start:21 stop:665 length:645 start_codon:yes stop_codon:yes gene_type:complete
MHQPNHKNSLTLGQRLVERFPSRHEDPQKASEQMRGLSNLVDFIVPQSKTDLTFLAAGPMIRPLRKLVKMKKGGVDMESFFSNLDWNKGGKSLWKKTKSLNNVKILTGGKDLTNDAISKGKRNWVEKNLGRFSDDVIVETKKEKYANPLSILVDDTPKNVDNFKKAGGQAILHSNKKETIKKLNRMLKKNPNSNVYLDLDGVLVDLKGGIERFK